jgi:hypothetical protein
MAVPKGNDFHMSIARTVPRPSVSASSRPEWDSSVPAALRDAVDKYQFEETPDWANLAELSDHTVFRAVELSAANSVFDNGSFIAPASVDVTLQFDPNLPEKNSFDDTYPARVYFKIIAAGDSSEKPAIQIERIETDTSSFFE